MLKAQGMLPSEVFDYKTVDFSSFQGGSTGSNAIQTQFQPPRVCIYTLNKYTHKHTHTHTHTHIVSIYEKIKYFTNTLSSKKSGTLEIWKKITKFQMTIIL